MANDGNTALDAGAIKAVAALAAEALQIGGRFDTVKVEGEEILLTTKGDQLIQIVPARRPLPNALRLNTLAGVGHYLTENRDGLDLSTVTVHVTGAAEVSVFAPLGGYHRQREAYLTATCEDRLDGFRFGQFYQVEDLIIALQARFADGGDRDAVVKLLGNLTGSASTTSIDDGVSQEVSVKAGVYRQSTATVPNPVMLSPYRTFPEVPQPQSPFVLRLRGGGEGHLPTAALFEADGGAWRLEAIASVAAFLEGGVPAAAALIF